MNDLASVAYHAAYEFGGDVTALPGGQAWLDAINQAPERERHLAVHDHHLVALNDADQVAWAAGSWAAIPTTTMTGSAAQLADHLAEYAEQGITEILCQPTGPDIAHCTPTEAVARPRTVSDLTTCGVRPSRYL